MTRHCQFAGALLLAALLLPARGEAMGDEVDYSAPYLTLENGELVTKYPAMEHDGDAQVVALDAEPRESKRAQNNAKTNVIAVAALAVILAGLFLMIRRGVRRQNNRSI